MKAVILARGLGTRLRRPDGAAELSPAQRETADRGVKALMPVGRPLLDYALSSLADAGCTDICLVIGPEHDAIRAHVAALHPRRVTIALAEQPEPRGTADAVLAARAFAGDDPFLVVNGDNLYPVDVLRATGRLPAAGLPAFAAASLIRDGNLTAARVGRFPRIAFDRAGLVTGITDRDQAPGPGDGPDEFVSMNCWRFTPAIFPACEATLPSASGELEIQAAARHAMTALGEPFHAFAVRAVVLDVTRRSDVGTVAARLTNVEVRL